MPYFFFLKQASRREERTLCVTFFRCGEGTYLGYLYLLDFNREEISEFQPPKAIAILRVGYLVV
jgi:hypothetical protein